MVHVISLLAGVKIPFIVYLKASALLHASVGVLTGPVAWAVSGGWLIWSLCSANEQSVAAFVVTSNIIKTGWFEQ